MKSFFFTGTFSGVQGNTEQHQLTLICQLCGSIVPDVWQDVEKLDLYNKMELPKAQKRKVKGEPNGRRGDNALTLALGPEWFTMT